jgi:hypothetical protein
MWYICNSLGLVLRLWYFFRRTSVIHDKSDLTTPLFIFIFCVIILFLRLVKDFPSQIRAVYNIETDFWLLWCHFALSTFLYSTILFTAPQYPFIDLVANEISCVGATPPPLPQPLCSLAIVCRLSYVYCFRSSRIQLLPLCAHPFHVAVTHPSATRRAAVGEHRQMFTGIRFSSATIYDVCLLRR